MATLVFTLDDQQQIVVPILGVTTIGCADGNDVVVDDPSIARRHAEIKPVETGGFHVRDVGSHTGTFVNGRQVQAFALRDGDEVSFGLLQGRFALDAPDWEEIRLREHEADAMRQTLADLRAACAEAQARHETMLNEVAGLTKAHENLLTNLESTKAEIASLKKQADVTAAALRKAEAGLRSKEKELAKAAKALETADAKRAAQAEEMARTKGEAAALRKELTALQREIGSSQTKLKGKKGKDSQAEQELRERLASERLAADEELRQLKDEQARLEISNAQAVNMLVQAQASIAEIAAAHLNAQQQLDAAEERIAEAEARATAVSADRLSIEKAVTKAQSDLQKLTKDSQSLSANLERLRGEEKKLTRSLDELKKRERQQQDEHRRLAADFDKKLEARRRELSELESRLQPKSASVIPPANEPATFALPPRKEIIATVTPTPIGIVVRPKTSIILRPRSS